MILLLSPPTTTVVNDTIRAILSCERESAYVTSSVSDHKTTALPSSPSLTVNSPTDALRESVFDERTIVS